MNLPIQKIFYRVSVALLALLALLLLSTCELFHVPTADDLPWENWGPTAAASYSNNNYETVVITTDRKIDLSESFWADFEGTIPFDFKAAVRVTDSDGNKILNQGDSNIASRGFVGIAFITLYSGGITVTPALDPLKPATIYFDTNKVIYKMSEYGMVSRCRYTVDHLNIPFSTLP